MNFQKLAISLLFSFTHFLQGEKIYPLYGGVWQGNSSDSNSICVFSIHSNTSQSIHLTNYKNYDTIIKIAAFQTIDFFIQRKFCMILVDENNKNTTRSLFAIAQDPLTISVESTDGPTSSNPKSKTEIKSICGSYQSIEKSNCGNEYVIYHPKSVHYSYSSTNNKYYSIAYCITIVAFEDATNVNFDLNFDTEFGRKFSKKLNKGETFQFSIKIASNSSSDESHWKLHVVNGGIIQTTDCNKKIAVYSINSARGVTLSKNYFDIDESIYPSYGIEIDQLEPIKHWGYEYLLLPDGKTYLGNTYHIFSKKNNTLFLNGKQINILNDTLIADTFFYNPILIQSTKPIIVTQYISGAINNSAFGAPDDKIYANLIDYTSIPPTNTVVKNITIPIPSDVENNGINRIVLFSPGNNKVEINGKTHTLIKKTGNFYWGSIQNTQKDKINIKSTTGINGYILHSAARDTNIFYSWTPRCLSGVLTINNDWDSLNARIRINKQGVYWYGTNDTNAAFTCKGNESNISLEAGWDSLQNVTCFLNNKLISKTHTFNYTFNDTGTFLLTFNYQFFKHGCDSGSTHQVNRKIIVRNDIKRNQFQDTSICATDTLKLLSNLDYQSTVKWQCPSKKIICDTCRKLSFYGKNNSTYPINITIQKTGCNPWKDTFNLTIFDTLSLSGRIDSLYCFGDSIRQDLNPKGGNQLNWKFNYLYNFQSTPKNTPITSDGIWTAILSDGCSLKSPTVSNFIRVDTINIVVSNPDSICKPNKILDLSTFAAWPKQGQWIYNNSPSTAIPIDTAASYPHQIKFSYQFINPKTNCSFLQADSIWILDTIKNTLQSNNPICHEIKLLNLPEEFNTKKPTGYWYCFNPNIILDSFGNLIPSKSKSGTYSVFRHEKSRIGCDELQSGTILILDSQLNISFNVTPISGNSPLNVNFSAINSIPTPTTFKWLFNDLNDIALGNNSNYIYYDTGKYKPLLIAKTNNCTDTIQLPTIKVGELAIATFNQSKLLNVFPNPAKQGEPITITIDKLKNHEQNLKLKFYDINGKSSNDFTITQNNLNQITFKTQTKGIYILKIDISTTTIIVIN